MSFKLEILYLVYICQLNSKIGSFELNASKGRHFVVRVGFVLSVNGVQEV